MKDEEVYVAAETGPPPADEPEPGRDRRLWTVIAALPYLAPVGLLLVLAATITLVAIGAYTREWEWTGFLGKSLWDWMKLLIVPIILALGGLLITQMERLNSARAQRLDQERLEQDRMQTQQQLELARRGQITLRFAQAIDHLGSNSLEVRLGGIYALERTAHEDRDWHWPILEVLSTYVREHAPRSREQVAVERPPAADIQAILNVIGRRSAYHRTDPQVEFGTIDLEQTDLRGADLRGAYLRGADLRGANLEGANLEGANLIGATMPDGSKHK